MEKLRAQVGVSKGNQLLNGLRAGGFLGSVEEESG